MEISSSRLFASALVVTAAFVMGGASSGCASVTTAPTSVVWAIQPQPTAIMAGTGLQFRVDPVAAVSGDAITWQVSGPAGASISATGFLQADSPGPLTVRAVWLDLFAEWSTSVVPDVSGAYGGTIAMKDCRQISGGGTSPCRFLVGPNRQMRLTLQQTTGTISGSIDYELSGAGAVQGTASVNGEILLAGTTRGGSADIALDIVSLRWLPSADCSDAAMRAELRFGNAFGSQHLDGIFAGSLCRETP